MLYPRCYRALFLIFRIRFPFLVYHFVKLRFVLLRILFFSLSLRFLGRRLAFVEARSIRFTLLTLGAALFLLFTGLDIVKLLSIFFGITLLFLVRILLFSPLVYILSGAGARFMGRSLILGLVSHVIFDILQGLGLADRFSDRHGHAFPSLVVAILIISQITRKVASIPVFRRRPFLLGPGALIPYLRIFIASSILTTTRVAGFTFTVYLLSIGVGALLVRWGLLFSLAPPSCGVIAA